jgi:hypothetical protein
MNAKAHKIRTILGWMSRYAAPVLVGYVCNHVLLLSILLLVSLFLEIT